jgi:hypothetical protein
VCCVGVNDKGGAHVQGAVNDHVNGEVNDHVEVDGACLGGDVGALRGGPRPCMNPG